MTGPKQTAPKRPPLAVRRERPFAPAKHHDSASSFARSSAVSSLGVAPLKTQSFLCLQIIHAPSVMRVFNPFLLSPSTVASVFVHQSSQESSVALWGENRVQHDAKENTKTVLQTHSQWEGAECPHLLGHTMGICLDGEGHAGPICLLSSCDYEQPSTKRTNTLEGAYVFQIRS